MLSSVFFLLMMIDPESKITFEVQKKHPFVTNSQFQIHKNTGDIYFNNISEIKVVDEFGKVDSTGFKVDQSSKFYIANFSIFENRNEMFVSSLKKVDVRSNFGKFIPRSYLYNLNSQKDSILFATNSENVNSVDVYYRQVFCLDDLCFVNMWNSGNVFFDSEKRMLEQVEFKNPSENKRYDVEGNYNAIKEVEHSGFPFQENLNQKNSAFSSWKRKWLAMVDPSESFGGINSDHERQLIVVDQLYPRIQFFVERDYSSDTSDEIGDWKSEGFLTLKLENWVHYFPKPKDMERGAYLRAFSRIDGFYKIQDGFIIGYKTKIKEKDTLMVQVLDVHGALVGEPMVFPGQSLLGVQSAEQDYFFLLEGFQDIGGEPAKQKITVGKYLIPN